MKKTVDSFKNEKNPNIYFFLIELNELNSYSNFYSVSKFYFYFKLYSYSKIYPP